MVALFLAAYYSEAGATIHIDCKGVITSVLKGGKRVVMGELVKHIWELMQEKGLKVTHVKAHVGIRGNECANTSAQTYNASVANSPNQQATNAFHVVFQGKQAW